MNHVFISVFCPYPGELKKGKILLVREIGKFEYQPYIKQVGHNEEIEYNCDSVSNLTQLTHYIVLRVITKNRLIITNHWEYWPLFFFNLHCLKVRKNYGGHSYIKNSMCP